MPVLKKHVFQKVAAEEFHDDDEEVFYCPMTNEIFRDYDEYCRRVMLCNSMVWSCAMTGKSHLTYQEALESEENARKSIKYFPEELRVPVLYLTTKIKRTGFLDMMEDLFVYVKDRYFVGENVEATFIQNKWKDAHVLQVVAPREDEIKKATKNGNKTERHHMPPASLFKYQVQHLDANEEDHTELMIVSSSQIRRKKRGSFSRERLRLFLKQYVEPNDQGIWVVKDEVLQKYSINSVKFEEIFDGPLPDFNTGKKAEKAMMMLNGKKPKQETLAKFLSRSEGENVKGSSNNNNNLLEKMKQREEEFRQRTELLKQQKAEEKLAEKQKRREDNVKFAMYVRDWYKPKEDLELEDQKPLPEFCSVESKIPDEHFGDVLMVLQFASSFSKICKTNKFFPGGLTLELMERALTENEVAGPLIDIIQMLLTALFNCQDEESEQYRTAIDKASGPKAEDCARNLTLTSATYLATKAAVYPFKHQGCHLNRLPMYPLTVTEVLRLHLLSSGARINDGGAIWRFQQRGGYCSEDDPGLYFRLQNPHILRALAHQNIVELSMGDKLKIVSCLVDQLLTYADVRDIIEEKLETARQARIDLKSLQLADRKREQEYVTAKLKAKREMKEQKGKLEAELEALRADTEKKKADNEKGIGKLSKVAAKSQVLLGQDRAFRKYLKIDTIPAVFVDFEEDNPGVCLDEPMPQDKHLIDADRTDTVVHLRKIHDDLNTSDKENQQKPQTNGESHHIPSAPTLEECQRLLICSADPNTCPVHSKSIERHRWMFLKNSSQLDETIGALNKRGLRENELKQNLEMDKEQLDGILGKTPVAQLNFGEDQTDERQLRQKKSVNSKLKYGDANLGYPLEMPISEIMRVTLAEYILEMEEKLYAGNLGTLKVKDREAWRECLSNGKFAELDTTLVKHENGRISGIKKEEPNSRSATPEPHYDDTDDPGKYLPNHTPDTDFQTDDEQLAVRSLAVSLAQVANSVEPKYLKKPLGAIDVKKDTARMKERFEMWEQSLLGCTSYSQIFLHYCTLDNCVIWSRSALRARCKICRRMSDSENMLLCDECNHGYHLYCLKPKLKSVPPGKWYCDKCLKQKEEEEKPKRPPPKIRRVFREEEEEMVENHDMNGVEDVEEDVEEEEDEEDDPNLHKNADPEEVVMSDKINCAATHEEQENEEVEEEEEENAEGNGVYEVCDGCGSGGELLCCDGCPGLYHLECVVPPLRNVPRGNWYCTKCKEQKEKREQRKRREQRYADQQVISQQNLIVERQRSCAAKAQLKIHGFIKSLRHLSDSEADTDDGEEVILHKRTRREDGRQDLPLHNAALHQLLLEVMRHDDAWPFIRPVQKTEVPDYYEVIAKPMDFGTIKYKLNMGEYKKDDAFMADATLVFENCNTYNNSEADVYRCGVRLQKHFVKKCRELGLSVPVELDDSDFSDDEELPKKKIRK